MESYNGHRDGSGQEIRSNSSQNSSGLIIFILMETVSCPWWALLWELWNPGYFSGPPHYYLPWIIIFWLVGLLSFLRQGFRTVALAGYINKNTLQITEPCTHTVSGVLVKRMCLYTRPWSKTLRDTWALFMWPTKISVYTLLATRLPLLLFS